MIFCRKKCAKPQLFQEVCYTSNARNIAFILPKTSKSVRILDTQIHTSYWTGQVSSMYVPTRRRPHYEQTLISKRRSGQLNRIYSCHRKQTGMDPIERLRFLARGREARKRNPSIASLPTALYIYIPSCSHCTYIHTFKTQHRFPRDAYSVKIGEQSLKLRGMYVDSWTATKQQKTSASCLLSMDTLLHC